ncbi:MAG TPA: arylesterase [Burkholderiales bacterium]|nr:arylesterase [Burkholderiales bacterium]
MKRFALLLAFVLAACGGGSPKLSKLPGDAVVLAFGDSLTFGTGANENESYPARLQALIGRKVVSAGVPGETTAAGLARLQSALDESRPALLVLCEGGNDFLQHLDDQAAARNLRSMIALARSQGAQVVLIGVPKPGLMPATAPLYGEIATELKIPYDDSMLVKILTDNELKSDLIHPNAKGYEKMAERVAALLRKSGAI